MELYLSERHRGTQYPRGGDVKQVPVHEGLHGGGEDIHPIHAPADEGGGHDLVPHTRDGAVALQVQGEETHTVHAGCGDAHVQAHEDEGGGDPGAADAHRGVGPAGGREHHDGSLAQGGDGDEGLQDDGQDHGLLGGRHEQQDEEAGDTRGMMIKIVCSTGGDDDNEIPDAEVDIPVTAKLKNDAEDDAVPDITGGGKATPTSDKTEAEDLKFLMSKISILARRGGGRNETCGRAHFILVAKFALHFPRAQRWVHLAADAPSETAHSICSVNLSVFLFPEHPTFKNIFVVRSHET